MRSKFFPKAGMGQPVPSKHLELVDSGMPNQIVALNPKSHSFAKVQQSQERRPPAKQNHPTRGQQLIMD